jgi:hypothetical protein
VTLCCAALLAAPCVPPHRKMHGARAVMPGARGALLVLLALTTTIAAAAQQQARPHCARLCVQRQLCGADISHHTLLASFGPLRTAPAASCCNSQQRS